MPTKPMPVTLEFEPLDSDPDIEPGGYLTLQRQDGRSLWQQRFLVVSKVGDATPLVDRYAKIAELRKRAGMSLHELAKAMGYARQSSIQRYLSPGYDLGFRPEMVQRFRKALFGRGSPPITDDDLQVFSDWKGGATNKQGAHYVLKPVGMFHGFVPGYD